MIYSILRSSIINVWPTLVILCVMLATVRIAYLIHHHTAFTFHKEFTKFIALGYALIFYELVTRVDANYISGTNYIPFSEIFRYSVHSETFYLNVIGNILLFIPFGYIIASYVKPKRMWSNIIITIIVSFTIEYVQANIGRCFDIDDIILNTFGSIIGYLLYIGLRAIKNHLPGFLQDNWFKNLICIIILAILVIYGLRIAGIWVI